MASVTIELPEELERKLKTLADGCNRTESEIVLQAIRHWLENQHYPRPTFPLFRSDTPDLAENCDKYLEGFGET